MLKNFKPRLYQETIFSTCTKKNCLVVLPTGMGKTGIALMLAAHRLKNHPNSKVVILAPTRPLVTQHYKTFEKFLDINKEKMVIFTGSVRPSLRQELFKEAKIIFSTPQGLENDLISGRINLSDVSLMVFDEAHRATGDYAYVWIAEQYLKQARFPKVLALTASPGSETEKILDVMSNLGIEAIEIRTLKDADVASYVPEVNLKWIKVEFPKEIKEAKDYLERCYLSKLNEIKSLGMVQDIQLESLSKKEILRLQADLHARVAQGEKDYDVLKALSLLAQAMKVSHALELIETQTIYSVYAYLRKLFSEARSTKVKAVINLVKDINFRMAWIKVSELYEKGIEHPKLDKLKEIIKGKLKGDVKLIIFTQYRDSAQVIKKQIEMIQGVKSEIFVGQAKKNGTGLSQKEQNLMLERFATGQFNVLIATSVAEEGIDIPKVDAVIFYEPIPSAIRHIQRKGRTGRTEKGEIYVLYTGGTRDEAYKWAAYYREKKMYASLEKLKHSVSLLKQKKETAKRLDEFTNSLKNNLPYIKVDYREKGSKVIKELIERGVKIKLDKLEVSDYIISHRVGIEFKTVEDFVNSIIDGRLLSQARQLRNNFDRPLIIVEGQEDIYSLRKIHPNAVLGMLSTLAISYGIPIIQTKNYRETATLLYLIAKNEQQNTTTDYSLHFSKPGSLKEQQEYVISSLPNIGSALAKHLLMRFGTVRNVMNATEEELQEIDLIGEKKARSIKELLDKEYGGNI